MQNKILEELKGLKAIIAKLIGTIDLPLAEQFSNDAVLQAAKQFQKLSIERGEWVDEHSIHKYLKNAHYGTGTFIRQEFGFSNYFKRGRTHYYNKKDLIALAKELKRRNVNLPRYIEYKEDKAKFQKCIESIKVEIKLRPKKKSFHIPNSLKDILSSPPKLPSTELILDDIERLKQEFSQYNLGDYVEIYNENHAMMKSIYYYQKYLESETRKRCKRWCENFNYANHALELVTQERESILKEKKKADHASG
jgi:hypothetical protein